MAFQDDTRHVHKQIFQEYKQSLTHHQPNTPSSDDEDGTNCSRDFSWTHHYTQVYRAFCHGQLRDSQAVRSILDTTRPPSPSRDDFYTINGVPMLGMEMKSIPLVALDTSARKKELYACVQTMQAPSQLTTTKMETTMPRHEETNARVEHLRRVSRSWTLPSKLYARYIAELLHRHNQETYY